MQFLLLRKRGHQIILRSVQGEVFLENSLQFAFSYETEMHKLLETLTELKEEVDLLSKERREFKREISALRVNLEKQRVTNVSLKKMKMELQPLMEQGTTIVSETTVSGRVQENIAFCQPILPITPSPIASKNIVGLQFPTSDDSPETKAVAAPEGKFMLPDLNIAFDEESGYELS